MIQLYFGDVVICGVTQGNVDRLLQDQPLTFRLEGKEPIKKVHIIFGKDKHKILDFLEQNGLKIPYYLREEADKDPL